MWQPSFGRVGRYTEALPSINLHNPLIIWSREILDLLDLFIAKPIATKLGKVVTCYEKRPTTKLHNSLNT